MRLGGVAPRLLRSDTGIRQLVDAETVSHEGTCRSLSFDRMRTVSNAFGEIDMRQIGVHLVALIGEYGNRAVEPQLPRIGVEISVRSGSGHPLPVLEVYVGLHIRKP